jgi:two-component system heavy metal sensor histidine kinase CusS
MGMSIRWRLTLWNTLALAVVLLGFSALVYTMLRHALYERVDNSLASVLQELESKSNPDLPYWIKEAKEHQDMLGVVYDSRGNVVEHTEELASASLPVMPVPIGKPQGYADMMLPILGHQRTLQATVNIKGGDLTVLLIAGLEEVDRELHELLVVLALAVPTSLVGAGGLAYFLAQKALAPMKRLHQLTEQITADHLDRRLPIANPNDELGHLAGTINAMIARLERSFTEIRRFTADASHELRTPLTAIRTEAEVALGRPSIAAEHQHLLGSILEECDRLTRMTDQLLTLSREDAGVARQVREGIDLAALVSRVVDTMQPVAEAKGVRLDMAGRAGLPMTGDEARLRQVFYNLLDNAIKYTPEGGKVEVRLEPEDQLAVVTVRDTGIGIAPEHLPRVFDRFYRVDKARTRAEGGTGLGLSIAKTIVVAHGGQIGLASTPGQGTTCTVKLPTDTDGQN